MRMKTSERRSAIIAAAAQIFRERGFQGASMNAIAARAGGSKATLYSYFPSKEDLFVAVVEDGLRAHAESPLEALSGVGSLRERLARFARRHVEFRLDDHVVAFDRMVIAEAGRSNLGEMMRVRYVMPRLMRLAEVLQVEMDGGRLRRTNPYRAATQLRLLAEGDLIERRLRGDKSIDAGTAASEVTEGLEAFLRAYAPEGEAEANARRNSG